MIERKHEGIAGKLVTIVAVVMSLYHILYIGHVFEYLGIYILQEVHRGFHIAFVLALIYLLYPFRKKVSGGRLRWYDVLLVIVAVAAPLYVAFTNHQNLMRWAMGRLGSIEIILAIVGIVMLLEATRRVLGWAMPLLAIILLIYALYGNYFPGFLQHSGFSLKSFINTIFYSSTGMFGFVTGISATLIIMFILFGEFLLASGAGEFFIGLALALAGKYRGGPAKVAIVASMFFGMISGATTANVATTGTITIPLMKKIGYSPSFAGAVESVASNGGQFTPPVMGAVAFIMAEWLGIPYWGIVVAAAVPALLYYIALYIYIDLEALRMQLRGLSPDQVPSIKGVMKVGWVYVIPVLLLLYFIGVLMYPPETAALYSALAMVVVSVFRKETRMGPKKLIAGLKGGAHGVLIAAASCITSGIIVASIMITGLGPKITGVILSISAGNMLITLVLTAIASFIFGMGMATVAIYMILVTLVAPALVNVGVPPLAIHLFVFWWGLTSFITPPVCPGVFVACAIAKSKAWETGITACRLGMLTYILPFIWVYKPALLLIGSPTEIITVTLTTLLMTIMLGYAIAGLMLRWWQRILLLIGASLVLIPNWIPIGIGVVFGIAVFLLYWRQKRQRLAPVYTPQR